MKTNKTTKKTKQAFFSSIKIFLTLILLSICTTTFSKENMPIEKTANFESKFKDVKIVSATVEFLAIGRPSLIKIKGESKKLEISNIKNNFVEFKIPLDDFDTGIKLRNQHMKEKYLETSRFPFAVLNITNLEKIGLTEINQSSKFKADLSLHGEKKSIDVENKKTGAKSFESNFEINITDFKIAVPSYMGVTVTEKIQVKVKLELDKEIN